MGFRWFDSGLRVPIPSEAYPALPKIEKVHQAHRMHHIRGPGIDEQNTPPKKQEPIPPSMEQRAYQDPEQETPCRKPALLAEQIMSSPVGTLAPDSSLEEAWKLIKDSKFRHIPILSSQKQLIGIISDRDLLLEAAGLGMGHKVSRHAQETHGKKAIIDLIKTRVLTASPDTEIREIARILFEEQIGAMPIVNSTGSLVGIITRSDILKALVNKGPLELWV